MRFVFRVDSSVQIGHGHFARCLTLAKGLRAAGHAVAFICRDLPGNMIGTIEGDGIDVATLPGSRAHQAHSEQADSHEAWLGVGWQTDARETKGLLTGTRQAFLHPDWLVVDSYSLDDRWQKELRADTRRLFVIDDLADRNHDCDVLLDQNLVANMRSRYRGRVNATCKTLLGPRFAMLQPEYAKYRDTARTRSGEIRKILVYFGGADNANLTGRAVEACKRLKRTDLHFDVVVAAVHPQLDAIRNQLSADGRFTLHLNVPTLANLMMEADFAIGAGGSTNWERLCLGLPALVITLADNQVPIAECLHKAGLVECLGRSEEIGADHIFVALSKHVDAGLDSAWSAACKSRVDGLGVERVIAALTTDRQSELRLRPAVKEDEALLLEWANDEETRRNAFSTEPISAEGHNKWFAARLSKSETCRIYIADTARRVPVGQVRFERAGDRWSIDYSVAAEFRGYGIAKRLLHMALLELKAFAPSAVVYGEVKAANTASRRVFEALGFAVEESKPDVFEFRMALPALTEQ